MTIDTIISPKLSVFISTDSFVFSTSGREGENRLLSLPIEEVEAMRQWRSKDLFDLFWQNELLPTDFDQIYIALGDIEHSYNMADSIQSSPLVSYDSLMSLGVSIKYEIPTAIFHFFKELESVKVSFVLLNSLLINSVSEAIGHEDFFVLFKHQSTLYLVLVIKGKIEVSNFFRVMEPMDVFYYVSLIKRQYHIDEGNLKIFIGGELEGDKDIERMCYDMFDDCNKLSNSVHTHTGVHELYCILNPSLFD